MTWSRMFSFNDPDKIAYIVNNLDKQLADYAALLDVINKEEDAKKKVQLHAQFANFQGSLWLAFIASLKDNLDQYRSRLNRAKARGANTENLEEALKKLNDQSIRIWQQQRQALLKQGSSDSLLRRIFGAPRRIFGASSKQSTPVISSQSAVVPNELHKKILARDQKANRIAVMNDLAQEKINFDAFLREKHSLLPDEILQRLPTLVNQMKEELSALETGSKVSFSLALDQDIDELSRRNTELQESAQVIKQYQRNLNRIREQSSSDPKTVSAVDDLLSPTQSSIEQANIILYAAGSPAPINENLKTELDQVATALALAPVIQEARQAHAEQTKANKIIKMTNTLQAFFARYDFTTTVEHIKHANLFAGKSSQSLNDLNEIQTLKKDLINAKADIKAALDKFKKLNSHEYEAEEIGRALRQYGFKIFSEQINLLVNEAKQRYEAAPDQNQLPEDIKTKAIQVKLNYKMRYEADFPEELGQKFKDYVMQVEDKIAVLDQSIDNLVLIENDLMAAKVAPQPHDREIADSSGASLSQKTISENASSASESDTENTLESDTENTSESGTEHESSNTSESDTEHELSDTSEMPDRDASINQQNVPGTSSVSSSNPTDTASSTSPWVRSSRDGLGEQNSSVLGGNRSVHSIDSSVFAGIATSSSSQQNIQTRRVPTSPSTSETRSTSKKKRSSLPIDPLTRSSGFVRTKLPLSESCEKTQAAIAGNAKQNDYRELQRHLEIENGNIKDLATQLTNWSRQLFAAIPPEEFLQKDKPELRSYSRLMTNAFNNLSNFVIRDILHTEYFEERLLVMNRWFRVLQETYAAGDYHTSFAISMAFSSIAIQDRLKKSWVSLPQEMLTSLDFLAKHPINNESFNALKELESSTREDSKEEVNDHSKGKEKDVSEVQQQLNTAIIPHMGYYSQQYEQYSTSIDRLESPVQLMQEMQEHYLTEEGATEIADIIDSLEKNYITNGAREHAAKKIDKALEEFISGLEAAANSQTPALKSLVEKLKTFRLENFASQGVIITAHTKSVESEPESHVRKKIKNILRRRKGKSQKKPEEIKSSPESPQKKDTESSYASSRFVEKSASIFSRRELAEEFRTITQPLVTKNSVISNELHDVIENFNDRIENIKAKRAHSLSVLKMLQQAKEPTSQLIPIAKDIGSEKKWLNGDIVGEASKKEFDEKDSILIARQDEEAKQLDIQVSPSQMQRVEQISYRLQMLNYVNQMEAIRVGTTPADYSDLFVNPQIADKIKTLSMDKEDIIGLLPDVEKINLASFIHVNDETFKELLRPFIDYHRVKSQKPLFTDQEIKKINSKNNLHYQIHNIALAKLLASLNLNEDDVRFINAELSNVNVINTESGGKGLIGINKNKLMSLLEDIVRRKENETNSFFKRFKAQPPWKSKLEVDEPTFQKRLTAILKENANLLQLIKNHPDLLRDLEIKNKEASKRTKDEQARLQSAEKLITSWLESYIAQLRYRKLSAHLVEKIENNKKSNQAIHLERMRTGRENIARILGLFGEEREKIRPFLNSDASKILESTMSLDYHIGGYSDNLKKLNNEISTLLPEELKSKFQKFIAKLSAEKAAGDKVEIPPELENELREILQERFPLFKEVLEFKLSLKSLEQTLKDAIDQKEIVSRKPLGPGSTSS